MECRQQLGDGFESAFLDSLWLNGYLPVDASGDWAYQAIGFELGYFGLLAHHRCSRLDWNWLRTSGTLDYDDEQTREAFI